MNLPSAADLTPDDREVVATLMRHVDSLADAILAAAVPSISKYRALSGYVQWGNKTGIFTPSVRHQQALRRLPPEAALRAWTAQERRLAAMRGA